MYTNTKGLRDHEVKVRFNDAEEAMIDSLVEYLGKQKAVFVREMAIEHIKTLLAAEQLNNKKVG